MATTQVRLSTIDNPYDPFTQFDEWDLFDRTHGYQSSALLAHLAMASHDLSQTDFDLAVEQAIDEIVSENVSGMFIKVTRTVDEDAEVS